MPRNRVYNIPFLEASTRKPADTHLLIDENGKIAFAHQAASLLDQVSLPEYIRELFGACLPRFDAAFASCLASGQSQCQLLLQAPGKPIVPVGASFALCTLPENTFQVLLTLQPALAGPGAPLPQPILPAASGFQQLDPMFLASQTLAQVGNFKFDFTSAQVEWTPAMFDIYRIPASTLPLPYPAFLEKLHPQDRPLFLDQCQHATISGSHLKMTVRILRGDNTTGFIQLTAQPWYNEAGTATGVFGTVVDITSLQESKQQLKASEERIRLLAENGSDVMAIFSAEGACTYMSSSATRILGYQPEDFLGQSLFDFIHPEDISWIQAGFQQIRQTERLVVPPFRFRTSQGDWRWMETIVTNYLDNPFIQGYATTSRDITDRRLGELKIQESEQRYKSLFEHHPDPVYSLNLEGQFMTANRQVSQVLGYETETVMGKDFRELIVAEFLPRTIRHFSHCRQGQARHYKTAVFDRKGNQTSLEVINIPMIVDGQVTGIFGIAKDITQLQKSREERQRLINRLKQKNHHLEQFASIVSHNLRAPVANILGLTNLFDSENPDSDISLQVIANLQKSAEDLDSTIHDLNQILSNRLGPNQAREMIDLAALVSSIQNTLKEDIIRNLVVIEADFTEVASIRTVKSYLHNILLSFIRHAICQQRRDKPLVIKMKTTRFENENCLTIQDNSLNLKRQKIDTLDVHRPLEAGRGKKGLLFQLIRTQVETIGGKVEMDIKPGVGATIKLYLLN